ncbi:MAG TPA: CSS-motif domain-containing protein, partial [Cellvibrionaceae bacterium]
MAFQSMSRTSLIAFVAGMLVAFVVMGALCVLAASMMRTEMRQQSEAVLSILDNINRDAVDSWSRLARSTLAPCSPPHLAQMRAELFLTWHIKDIAYIKEGEPFCTAAQGIIAKPPGLEQPDFYAKSGAAMWINLPWPVLDTLRNTAVAVRDHYGVVVDPQTVEQYVDLPFLWQMTFQ